MAANYEESVGQTQLTIAPRDLTATERASLWRCFVAIEEAWELDSLALPMKPQWLDLIDARCRFTPSYLGEFVNASAVVDELIERQPDSWIQFLFFGTIATNAGEVDTRLQHAKYFVVNDFIRAFVLLGGFTAFGGRNYTGYMGGSRFGALPPVRAGSRL